MAAGSKDRFTLRQGQRVVYPRSPDGVAQVDDLKGRRVCRVVISAERLAKIQRWTPMLPGFVAPVNYLGRGIVGDGTEKTFEV
jgi:hypothetical protein